MRFGAFGLLILLSTSATLAFGQSLDSATDSAPLNTPPLVTQGTVGPPLDLLSLSHAGTEGGEHPEPKGEVHLPNEPETPEHHRCYARADYLLWWIKNTSFPVLLTTGSVSDARPGAVGMPGTGILFGGTPIDNKERSGARVGLGYWLDDARQVGLEAGYFYLSDRSVGAFAASSGSLGSRVLARPFFDVNANRDDSSLVAYPGVVGGNVNIGSNSELHSAEANLLWNLSRGQRFSLDALAGFRFLSLDEHLNITEVSVPQATSPRFPDQRIIVADRFSTSNDFYGGQLGLRAGLTRERWRAELTAKVGLGVVSEGVNINGFTSIQPPGQTATVTPGGLLALASNSGRSERDQFAVVPQLDANIGYQLTPWLRVSVGYSFLYWSAVGRPSEQIDRGVNLSQVPTSQTFGTTGGAARPAFSFHETDFFAHGLNVGLELRY